MNCWPHILPSLRMPMADSPPDALLLFGLARLPNQVLHLLCNLRVRNGSPEQLLQIIVNRAQQCIKGWGRMLAHQPRRSISGAL